MTNPQIDVLLSEKREFFPSEQFKSQAHINSLSVFTEASQNSVAYWETWAKQLTWFQRWSRPLRWNPPHAEWFIGGKLNACFNCVDRHVFGAPGIEIKKDKTAILWEGEPGDVRRLTYEDLWIETTKCANVLFRLGVRKGDRVAIYMPMVPEAAVAMLACARLGAVHSVVFGGFSVDALRDRINDAQAKVVITSDGGWRRGKKVGLKAIVDDALKSTPSVKKALVFQRTGEPVVMQEGRDVWWHEAMAKENTDSPAEPMDAEDMLFILYTSGTTGKPKGIVHTTGGYLTGVFATTKWVFDLKDDDIFWCTADVGWVTGHSYVVYGPLSNGATVMMYEGAPDFPHQGRFWELIQKYKPTIFYTAPTAIRAFMKWGEDIPARFDLKSLRLLGSVGEPINPEAWIWYHEHIGGKKCPIVDTWWQTETGAIMITTLPGAQKAKPSSAGTAFPGISAKVLNDSGEELKSGGGCVAITEPWPSMLRTVFGDDKRYQETYWAKWNGRAYFPGDGVHLDEDGYFWFMGRVDDVMKVAGHLLATAEIESAFVDHHFVAEAAVVGRPHEIKGQGIAAFVTVKKGVDATPALAAELKEHVARKIGPIARPDDIIFTADLPKTRSGKIMRRLLRDIACGKALGDTTTLADPAVVESLKAKYAED
ncbi:MAG TPA: acetate--CoA ligase [Candidatus Omnitrophica bacterium]|nr:acetate--CoA ligase [Candidatus Omnitrophota bacterium]